ncbi:MAG: GTPase Era [Syntrophus sp. SKADARSKE-3]|nr:GTPase Era [Syntrophus sp. SKADARSKE-3]
MFKSGFIGIVGRPNVGKSTLLNAVIGDKIAIATHKPQTTRNRITAIKNIAGGQLVFIDTPGIHRASTLLGHSMVDAARSVFDSVDIILFLIEAPAGILPDDRAILETLQGAALPVILIINKIDLVEKPRLLPLIDEANHLFPFLSIIPMSALQTDGIHALIEEIRKALPEGQPFFPEEMFTDRSERFIAAETIREKIMLMTHKEVPYATAVTVDSFKEDEAKNLIRIAATITVEKESQKGIIIGKGGAMLKKIGTQARQEMEKFFAARIFLELFVRVRKDWTHNEKLLKEFGYKE